MKGLDTQPRVSSRPVLLLPLGLCRRLAPQLANVAQAKATGKAVEVCVRRVRFAALDPADIVPAESAATSNLSL